MDFLGHYSDHPYTHTHMDHRSNPRKPSRARSLLRLKKRDTESPVAVSSSSNHKDVPHAALQKKRIADEMAPDPKRTLARSADETRRLLSERDKDAIQTEIAAAKQFIEEHGSHIEERIQNLDNWVEFCAELCPCPRHICRRVEMLLGELYAGYNFGICICPKMQPGGRDMFILEARVHV